MVEVRTHLEKLIAVRLSAEKWEALRKQAREQGIGPTTLARMLIEDGLCERTEVRV